MPSSSPIDVSLPPHLYSILLPLITLHLLSGPLSSELNAVLSKYTPENQNCIAETDLTAHSDADTRAETNTFTHSRNTIPYSLLHSVAVWARSPEGSATLTRAGLLPSSYGIVSLLAGTQTKARGPALPPSSPDDPSLSAGGLGKEDRKAIVALINALVSIVGSGAAGWWAAGGLGWRDEWVSQIIHQSSSLWLPLTRN